MDNSTGYPSWDTPTNMTNSSSSYNYTSPGNWTYNNTSSVPITAPLPFPSALPFNATAATNISGTPDPQTPFPDTTYSQATPDVLPKPTGFHQSDPNVMGHAHLNAGMWKNSGVIIGVACSVVGSICVIFGLIYSIHLKRKTRPSIHSLRVVSGYDFNGGSEDDGHCSYMTWTEANFSPIHAKKTNPACDAPLTTMSALRHSAATVYSNNDEEEHKRNSNSFDYTHEKGIAR